MYVIARGKEYSSNPQSVIAVHNNVEKNSASAIGSLNTKNRTGGFLFTKYYLGLEDEPYDSYKFLSNYLYFGKIQHGKPNENPTSL